MKRFKAPFKSSQKLSQNSFQSQTNGTNRSFASNSDPIYSQNRNNYSIEKWSQNESQISTKSNESAGNVEVKAEEVYALDGTRLRPVSELPPKYRPVFMERFPHFNCVQSKVFEDVFCSDKSITVCAPTGSGKTVLFELAIIRELMEFESNNCAISSLKTIYMAPLKKLVDEKFDEFKLSFARFGLNCLQLTGDSDIEDYEKLRNVNIVLTTPEKWDSMIRNNENRGLIRTIQLMLIDEIHTINDETRGARIEAVVSRMKTLRSIELQSNSGHKLRFVAASATAPNVDDIAHWLDPNHSVGYNLSDDLRPVKLQKIVLGYQCKDSWNDFRFDIQLTYKLDSLVRSYSDSKPTLIFCSTRKSVEMTAQTLLKSSMNLFSNSNQKLVLLQKVSYLKNNQLKNVLQKGIGFHHSGLDKKDREIIERLFIQSALPVLISTTTLSMGVNLPAHLVIIKNTSQYAPNGCHEYPETQILQMIGRAGRPKYDTSAVAIIMTKEQYKCKYENLLKGTQIIESNLHKNLVEQLNAEIALSTITSLDIAVDWIRSTFLYIRVLKNPVYYGSTVQMSNIEQTLQLVKNWCLQELTGLKDSDLISTDSEFSNIYSTGLGTLMARNCVSFKTMKIFCEMSSKELSLEGIIEEITKCSEIGQEIQLRVNEKKILNEMNQNTSQQTIRFPISGKIKSADMKTNCLIQATFGALPIQDSTLNQDSLKIMRTGQRMSKCLAEVMYFKVKQNLNKMNSKTLLNAILLNKCFKAKLWHDSPLVAKQLNRIGNQMSKALVEKGFKNFDDIRNADPRDLEFCVKRNPPFGRQLMEEVKHLPFYTMTIEQNLRNGLKSSEAVLKIRVRLENVENLIQRQVLMQSHSCFLLVVNEENDLFYCNKLYDSTLIRNKGIFDTNDIVVERNYRSVYNMISAHLISDSFVGLDVECKVRPQFAGDFAHTADPYEANCSTALDTCEPNTGNKSKGCQHKCLDKTACLHNCCKKGLNLANSEKPNEDLSQKQVTRSKRQQNLVENSSKKAKANKREASSSKPNTNLYDWLIRSCKQNANQSSKTETNDSNDSLKSVYFSDQKYSEIADNESRDEMDYTFNDNNSNDLMITEMDFNNDLDFEDSIDIEGIGQPIDDRVDKHLFDDGLDEALNDWNSCNEDFQQFDRKTDDSIEGNDQKSEKWKPFSMSQWSLYMPTAQVSGKSFFTQKSFSQMTDN